jgi:lipopolysaccharide export system permease protein
MRTFDRYILSHLLMLFGFFSLVLIAVYWVNRAIRLFDRLIAGGSNVTLFLELTVLSLPSVILTVLPISALVATLYGINRLTAESEIVVAQTTGLGPWDLARPVAYFGITVAVLMALLAHVLVPASRVALSDRNDAISQDITGRFLTEGEFLHPGTGVTVYVRDVTDQGELLGIFLQDRRNPDLRTTYTAERAILLRNDGAPRLVMFMGTAQTLAIETRNLTVVTFDDFTYDLAVLVGGKRSSGRDPREMSTAALFTLAADPQARGALPRGILLHEAHIRIAEPALAATLPVLALAIMMLGGFSRLGLWRQILTVVILAIVLKLGSNVIENAVRRDADLWALTYAPAVAGAALAALTLAWGAYAPRGRRRQRAMQA